MLIILRFIIIALLFCLFVLALSYVLYIAKTNKTEQKFSVSGFKVFCSNLVVWMRNNLTSPKSESTNDDWDERYGQGNKLAAIKSTSDYGKLQEELNLIKRSYKEASENLEAKEKELITREKEWSTDYNNLEKEKSKLLKANEELTVRISNLTKITGKLYPVSEDEVAIPFCNFFDELNGILNRTIISTINLPVDTYSELQALDYLTLINIEEDYLKSDPLRWYTLLKSIPAITLVAAKDIETKTPEEQLLYLKKHLFLECLRPRISQTLLFLDKTRVHFVRGKLSTSGIDTIIDDCIKILASYDISVVHYNTYDILSTNRYDLLEIKNIDDQGEREESENKIISVVKYGVNASYLGENDDKTILEMKI